MSESKNMHGRKEGHFKNAQHKSCRRPRTRLHVELDADLSAKLAAVLQAENLTQREWMHAAVTASLGKRGFGAAGRRLFLGRLARERQLFLRAALYAVNRLHAEPLTLHPSQPIRDHVYAVVASARLKDVRDLLLELLRHVAALVELRDIPVSSAEAKNKSDQSRGRP